MLESQSSIQGLHPDENLHQQFPSGLKRSLKNEYESDIEICPSSSQTYGVESKSSANYLHPESPTSPSNQTKKIKVESDDSDDIDGGNQINSENVKTDDSSEDEDVSEIQSS